MKKSKINEIQEIELCSKCMLKPATDVHHLDENHKNDAPENLLKICTLCHAKLHNIEPKKSEIKRLIIMRDRAIQIKNGITNQVRAFGRIEYAVPVHWTGEQKFWENKILSFDKEIIALMNSGQFAVWDKYLTNIKGIAEVTAAKLIGYIDIKNTPTISALWRYCGLDASHIKRKVGCTKEEAKKFGNPYLKKELIKNLVDNFIKQRTPVYREIYDEEKARRQQQHKDGLCSRCTELKLNDKPGHSDMQARRKVAKIFLSNLWVAWRTLEGLPIGKPYVEAILGHSKIIQPVAL